MVESPDLIIISQSNLIDYKEYSKLSIDRLELFQTLVYPRMVWFKGGFRSHLDILSYFKLGKFFDDSTYQEKRASLNIWNLPGYAGLHLANFLSSFDIKTAIINNFDSEWDKFREFYGSCEPSPLIGVSSTFYLSYNEISRLLKKIKNHFPRAEIALGGAFMNEQYINKGIKSMERPMRKFNIDYIFHAFNSEIDLKDFILNRKNGNSSYFANNMCILKDGRFSETPVKWHDPIINETPAHWEKIDPTIFNSTYQLRTASGCPYACAFCSYPKTAGGYYKMGLDVVEKHLDCITSLKTIKNIIFIDDTLNIISRRFKGLCRLFSKYDFNWYAFIRANLLTEEIVKLMADSGCKTVFLGIESASDSILHNMNKKSKVIEYASGINLLKKYGISTVAAFVLGFPGETKQSIDQNIEFIENSGIDFYSLKEFYYMEHTSVYKNREKFGLSGLGNQWKHNTMSSTEASNYKIEMFKQIKNSVNIDPDLSLWYVAYLVDQGYGIPQIKKIQTSVNTLMLEQLNGKFDDNSIEYQKIARCIV